MRLLHPLTAAALTLAGAAIAQSNPTANIPEAEHNDSEAYANDLGQIFSVATTATGTLTGGSTDADTYRFEVLFAGELEVTATGTGVTPWLQLSNANGDAIWGIHYWDTGSFKINLPTGVYHLMVATDATLTVPYSLALKHTPQPIGTLAFGTASTATFSPSITQGFRVVLPADGRLNVTINSNNNSDTILALQNAQWGYIYDSDDGNSASGSTAAGLDARLPKGTYYIYVSGDQADTASVTATFQAETIPTLGTTPIAGNLQRSDSSYDLYRFIVATTERITVELLPGTTGTASTDTSLQILDSRMQSLGESWENSTSFFSTYSLTLPPGTYYAASSAYWDSGTYRITLARAAAAIQPARAGTNRIQLATDRGATLAFSLATRSPVEINLFESGTLNCQVALMDRATGRAIVWEEDEYMSDESCAISTWLPAGDYLLQIREYNGTAGSCDVSILTPLHRFPGNIVGYQGHGGSLLYFVLGTAQVPPYNPLAGILSGNLLIPLGAPTVLQPLPLTASGKINFGASLPPGSGVFLQAVEIDLSRGLGFYTNLLK